MSYHGQNAWQPQTEYYNRQIGLMFCGKYAVKGSGEEDDFLYLAMNMHWEKHELALPKLPRGMNWKMLISTETKKTEEDLTVGQGDGSNMCALGARSIVVYIGVKDNDSVKKSRKGQVGIRK